MPFAPTDLTNLTLWLKADAGVYTDAGSTLATDTQTVQQWNDQSGSGHHYTQATSGQRPVYRTSQYNSLPAIRFDGADDALGGISVANPFTIFVVYAWTTNGRARALNGSNNWLVGPYDGCHNAYMNGFDALANVNSVQSGLTTRACVRDSGTVATYFRNGANRTVGTPTRGDPGTLYLGGGAGSIAFEPFGGDILEVLVYTRALSDAEYTQVDDYLYGRWAAGISGTGPSSLTGCYLWLKADTGVYSDAGVTLAVNGDGVYQWNDQSGYGRHFTQTNSTARPIYTTGVVNSLPCLRFDGTDDVLNGVRLPCPFTAAVVYSQRGGTTGNHRALGGTSPLNWLMGPYGGQHRNYQDGFVDDGSTVAVVDGELTRGVAINSDGGDSAFYVNNTDQTTTVTARGLPGVLNIGSGYAGGGSEWLPGDVAEVLVFDHALNSTERGTLDTYLQRWVATSTAVRRRFVAVIG